ncbi:MAG TPA: Uma2 family endonuclease [Solirubrobacteraceae bacterium]|jgi:Uma2 family endonuclease
MATTLRADQQTLPIHRLDLATYNRMVASGALDGERVELLDGVIVDMSPHSPGHAAVIRRLARHLALSPRWWTQVQLPIEVPPDSEPEPDIAVLANEPPPGRHPRSALLVIEVAVSSHAIDRGRKASLYAAAGIPEYWLVDVPGRAVEVRSEPTAEGYRRCEIERARPRAKVAFPLEDVPEIDLETLFADVVD